MAKDKVAHVRAPRPKNVKQIAKREANIKAAEIRNAKLAELNKAKNDQRLAAVANYQRQVFERAYVDAALKGPHAYILNRWLVNRAATFERVSRFFNDRPHFNAPQPTTKAA